VSDRSDIASALVADVPYFASVLEVLVRRAVRDNERAAMLKCLEAAFAQDVRTKPPAWVRQPVARTHFHREWKAAQHLAAEDLLTAGLRIDDGQDESDHTGEDQLSVQIRHRQTCVWKPMKRTLF
jgi:hypothetical protein